MPLLGLSERFGRLYELLFGRKLTEKEWINRRTGKFSYAWWTFRRAGFRVIPAFSRSFTIGGFLLGLARLCLLVLISVVPIVFARWFQIQTSQVSSTIASAAANPYYQALTLAALQFLKIGLDRLKLYRTVKKERLRGLADLSVALSATIGALEKEIRSISKTGDSKARLDAVLTHALKCVETTVKLCTDNMDDRYCCATLLIFEEGDQIRVMARSMQTRPAGKSFDRSEAIAHSVARFAKDSFAIHHFKRVVRVRKENALTYRGLSQPGKPPYESILALPLPPVTIPAQNRPRIRKGVVTIDASLPYEFLGRETEIVVRVQAYLELINLILTNHLVGVEPELGK